MTKAAVRPINEWGSHPNGSSHIEFIPTRDHGLAQSSRRLTYALASIITVYTLQYNLLDAEDCMSGKQTP